MKCERRYVGGVEVRRAGGRTTITGTLVPYGRLSENLGFGVEEFAVGAFTESLRSNPSVPITVEHDPTLLLGRAPQTATVTDSPMQLRFEVRVADTQTGHDAITSVERGDMGGASVEFVAVEDTWSTLPDGTSKRIILKAELRGGSITARPAYEDTSLALRSLDAWRKENEMPAPKTAEKPTTTDPKKSDDKKPEQRTVPAEPKAETTPTPEPERRTDPIGTENTSSNPPTEWRDQRTGREVRVLGRDHRFADLYRSDDPLSLGRAVRAMIVGDWSGAEAEHRALSTSSNPSAGILVPNPLAARVIDLARAKSVLAQAGAQTVSMDASTLKIARLSGDATVEVHAENVALTASDVTFDAVELTAYTIATLVKMSRELAADAPNAASIIETAIAAKLAERIDNYGLNGTGSQQPLGLLNFTGMGSVAVGGAVDYDNILDGMADVEGANHVPNAWIASPAEMNLLRQLKRNAEANNYATPPAAVQGLLALSTSNMPDTTIAVGDFSKFTIGLRQSPMIEVSTEAGNAFEEHAVYIKITWRGAFATEDRTAFSLLTGIV